MAITALMASCPTLAFRVAAADADQDIRRLDHGPHFHPLLEAQGPGRGFGDDGDQVCPSWNRDHHLGVDGAEGRVLLQIRRPWRDGTRAIAFTPSELLEKLVAIRPPVGLGAPRTGLESASPDTH